jgi:hypothetical protein
VVGGQWEFFQQRPAEVAAEEGVDVAGVECVVDHRGGGGLSGRACDADGDGLARDALDEQGDFCGDGNARSLGGEEIGVLPRLGNGGVGDDEVGGCEIGLDMPAEGEADVPGVDQRAELGDGVGKVVLGLAVGDGDDGPLARKESCGTEAAAEAAQAHDGNAPALQERGGHARG